MSATAAGGRGRLESAIQFAVRFFSVAAGSIVFSSVAVVLGVLFLSIVSSLLRPGILDPIASVVRPGSLDPIALAAALFTGSILTWFVYLPAMIALSLVLGVMFAENINVSWIWPVLSGLAIAAVYVAYLHYAAFGSLSPHHYWWSLFSLVLILMGSAFLSWWTARYWRKAENSEQ